MGVSTSWPHAIDTPTSHWHGVSSEECLGDGQPLLLEQTQKSWQCSRWWMVLPDLSLQVVPKIFYWIEIRAAGWPVHPDHPWPRHSSDDTPCQWDIGVYVQVANRTLWPASTPEVNWHHGLCTLQLQINGTDGPPHPPGLSHLAETDTSHGHRMSQPPTSCGEQWNTCTAPPNSWQHVDWGSKHGWSTAEEEEELTDLVTAYLHQANQSQRWPSRGFWPEWYISKMLYSRDTPFWSETLTVECQFLGRLHDWTWIKPN